MFKLNALTLNRDKFLKQHQLTKEVLLDYFRICLLSRFTSETGRKEVYMGKAKFGIFGAGKELAQVVMAHFFEKGDWRSGYYRDQTFMFAIGEMTPRQLFAQLYAHPDIEHEPVSAGRMMTGHFGTRSIDENGNWLNLVKQFNSSVDISPTAAQMPRLVGLAQASKLYRDNPDLKQYDQFSNNGNEIAWGTIGNASTAEGVFWEAINAGGVIQAPMLVSIWDDGYGISVPNELQVTKGDISKILEGFRKNNEDSGYEIFTVNGWDFVELMNAYGQASKLSREQHIPTIVHVKEMTQPQGHSTSGSHERYKTEERLQWEKDFDCIGKFKEWLLDSKICGLDELSQIEEEVNKEIKTTRNIAWKEYVNSMKKDYAELKDIFDQVSQEHQNLDAHLRSLISEIDEEQYLIRSVIVCAAKKALRALRIAEESNSKKVLLEWVNNQKHSNHLRYSAHLYSSNPDSALYIKEHKPIFTKDSPLIDGYEILQHFFDKALENDPKIFAFGEDVGKIGDVNQGFAGLQEKHGDFRVMDTGIRECTIIGQAIGTALRGLKPICEVQYVDYMLYAIQIISDDLATLHYRSYGGQKAPVIIRTRGHRLEGVWHSGSPLGVILHSIRGVYVCVPRNMTQAAGMYNTLLKSGDPGMVIECLNGYRLKERLPENIGDITVPLGIPEILREGEDVTIVTYGAMCRIALNAAEQLAEAGISCEVIDVQTLLPFDREKIILNSLKKTNKILFADEDVPGGTTAYMMQQVLERQGGYYYLDSKPKTIHSWAHRPAYATDGDYFSKANTEDVFDYVYEIMHESDPQRFPSIYNEEVKPDWKSI